MNAKLAEFRKQNGGKSPTILYVPVDDLSFGERGIPELNYVRGLKTPRINMFAEEGISFMRMPCKAGMQIPPMINLPWMDNSSRMDWYTDLKPGKANWPGSRFQSRGGLDPEALLRNERKIPAPSHRTAAASGQGGQALFPSVVADDPPRI